MHTGLINGAWRQHSGVAGCKTDVIDRYLARKNTIARILIPVYWFAGRYQQLVEPLLRTGISGNY